MAWTSPISRLAQRLKDDDDLPDQEGVKENALFLAKTCPMIEATLVDAEKREIRDENVKLWLCDLKYLAADAENTLEEYEDYHSAAHNHDEINLTPSPEPDRISRPNSLIRWLGSYIQLLPQFCGRPYQLTEGRNDKLGRKGESTMAALTMTSPMIRLAQRLKDIASFLENTCQHIEAKLVDAEESDVHQFKCLVAGLEDILGKNHSPAHNHDVMEDIEGKESSKDILKFRSKFDDIYVRRKALRLKDNGYKHPETSIRPLSGPLPNEPIIYGRDGDKKLLLDLLKNNKSKNLYVGEVIGLIGIGGSGKTTLAQLLYNDEEIKNYFNYRAWVSVSKTFDVVQITKNILESFTRKASDLTQLGSIQEELQKLLQEKKFFLVLDEMWDEVISKSLGFLLQMGLKGSKILITTRIPQVVRAMAAASVTFELEPLSKEDRWDLFRGHTFDGKSEDQLAFDQVRNGKEIVEKCKC